MPGKAELVLLGDFNIIFLCSEMNNDKAKKRKPLQVTNIYHLDQLISTPTRITERSSTLIDLLLKNTSHCVSDRGVIPSPLSDHCLIFCVIKSGQVITENKSNPSALWETLNDITSREERIPISCIEDDGVQYCSNKSIAKILNNHFSTTGTKLAQKLKSCRSYIFSTPAADR